MDTTPKLANFATTPGPAGEAARRAAAARLMGLAVFGEKVAAYNYVCMAKLRPEHNELLLRFAHMEGQHGAWFAEACRHNDLQPDEAFANKELGYLRSQVEEYRAAGSFESIAIVQGFIVESLAIATYEAFLGVAHQYPGTREPFERALADERYHVSWIIRYLRLRFFDHTDEFTALAERVNTQGVDCIGGTMMNIAGFIDAMGFSGADCAGSLIDGYTRLLEEVGVESKQATRSVVSLFMPLMRKHRRGEATK